MAIGKKVSPAKFIGTVALGLGIAKGVSSIIGGISERKRLKRENERAKKQYQKNRADLKAIDITNPYQNLQTKFENPFEDLTINQQQADFEAQQAAQSRANILGTLRQTAGGSGIAGLAQAVANQATTDTARASASIGRQEAVNQRLSAQGAQRAQFAGAEAERVVARGEAAREASEAERQRQLIDLRVGRNMQARDFRAQRAQAMTDIVGGIGQIAAAGFTGYSAALGGVDPVTNKAIKGFDFGTMQENLSKPSSGYSDFLTSFIS